MICNINSISETCPILDSKKALIFFIENVYIHIFIYFFGEYDLCFTLKAEYTNQKYLDQS